MRKSAARISAFDDLVFSSQLGRLVRERRREQGLSQEHVVELTNGLITQNWLSKLETGEYLTAPVGKLQALSVALNIPRADLDAAQKLPVRLANQELAKGWAVSENPIHELVATVQGLEKQDLRTLVRLARVMAYGKQMRDGHGDDPAFALRWAAPTDEQQELSDGAGIGQAAR